jgi:hypothetical protein
MFTANCSLIICKYDVHLSLNKIKSSDYVNTLTCFIDEHVRK